MTIIVGALYDGGIVLGADSMLTTITPGTTATVVGTAETDKIRLLADGRACFLHTGDLGAGQRVADAIEKWVKSEPGLHKRRAGEIADALKQKLVEVLSTDSVVLLGEKLAKGQALNPFLFVKESINRLGCGIFAIEAAEQVAAVHFEGIDTFTRLEPGRKEYFVGGSGMLTGDSFLEFVRRVIWKSGIPPKRSCLLGVYWALHHAILRGGMSGVGGRPDLAVLERQPEGKHASFARVAEADLEQLAQDVEALEKKIGDLPDAPVAKEEQVPPPPAAGSGSKGGA